MNNSNEPACSRPKSQCAALMRKHDWGAAGLADLATWSDLRTLADAIMRSPRAMALMWGVNGTLVYNDAFSPILGARHPMAFGRPVAEAWAEYAEFNTGLITRVLAHETITLHNQRFVVTRNGMTEVASFDIDCSAVCRAGDEPGGTLTVWVESPKGIARDPAPPTSLNHGEIVDERMPSSDVSSGEFEKALSRAQKTATVGLLTPGVAHEFNNLLQGITGSLEVVRKLIGLGRAADTERFTSAALSSARRAAALTDRLLTFARPAESLQAEPVEVNALIASVEDLLRGTQSSSIKLELALAADLWATVCRRDRLEHAIVDLVINARSRVPGGGTVVIETGNVDICNSQAAGPDVMVPGQYIRVAVSDSGPGISQESIQRTFDPFSEPPGTSGPALALRLIRRFAREADGYVSVASRIGRGTTISLYLPRFANKRAETP